MSLSRRERSGLLIINVVPIATYIIFVLVCVAWRGYKACVTRDTIFTDHFLCRLHKKSLSLLYWQNQFFVFYHYGLSLMTPLILQAKDGARATITPHGAHVYSWIPAGGREQLFLSKASSTSDSTAIRGGVPVIFPQFANVGALPKHGFARTSLWRLVETGYRTESAEDAAYAIFDLRENIARLQIWPHVFRAELAISVVGNRLTIQLSIHNTGDTSFSFTSALHTYLAVDQIADVSVNGLAGLRYRDSVSGVSECLEQEASLRINGEIDRIYANVPQLSSQLVIHQPQQITRISQTGFTDAVVWNPGAEKAAALADMEAGGEQRMLCIEAATVMYPVVLAPGAGWTGSQTLSVEISALTA